MARATATSRRTVLQAGTWKGVRDTVEPFDDTPDLFVDATNVFIPDPLGGSAAFSRSGFNLLNNKNPLLTAPPLFRGQCVYTHLAVDGSVYNFLVMRGRLFRVSNDFGTFTDVTPAGTPIDPGTTTRVKMVSLADDLIISDGVHRPWVASNLTATPVTQTPIDYDGAGVSWAAQDITVYGGALFAILKQVAGVPRQSDISWSEPGQPATGWQQLDFDNNWTLEQTGSAPLYAIVGTNVALYYFRQRSIGAIAGAVGPDLQSTSTHDAISFNVGTLAWQSIQTFGNYIYFTDALGRPWRLALGGVPEPIWLNMRSVVDRSTTGFGSATQAVTTSAFEPTLNLYLIAIWSPEPTIFTQPVEMYAFDARSGIYIGRWNIKGPSGVGIDAMGVFLDSFGGARLIVLGTKTSGGPGVANGYVWSFNSQSTIPSALTTERIAPVTFITTEGSARRLMTESQAAVWLDDEQLPDITVRTQRLGYQADVVWLVDRATVITGNPAPLEVSMISSTVSGVVQGTPTPSPSADRTWRLVCGCRVFGRGTEVRVRLLDANTQWALNRIQIVATPSQARPEDA